MTSDRDKSKIGERLTGAHDPQDPDGLLRLDDVEPTSTPGPDVASDEYPRTPGRHKATPHDHQNGPIGG